MQVVRNTPRVFGVAVYTGHDTKIMKNNERDTVFKSTKVCPLPHPPSKLALAPPWRRCHRTYDRWTTS